MRNIIFYVLAISISFVIMSSSSCMHRKPKFSKRELAEREERARQDSIAAVTEAVAIYNARMKENSFEKATVIDNTGLDGCGYMLELEPGKRLQPLNLEENYKKNGLKVWVKYTIIKDAVTVCMAGEVVRLISIEERK